MIGFWFLEVSSLLFVYMLFNFFFSGHMFPIDMLPGRGRTLVGWLPLQYLAYFPAAVFLGKIQAPSWRWGLLMQVGLGRVLHRRSAAGSCTAGVRALQRVWRLGDVARQAIRPYLRGVSAPSPATAWCAT